MRVSFPHMPATPKKAKKHQTYAGATFQNSPAPSSLPIPQFSKSLPDQPFLKPSPSLEPTRIATPPSGSLELPFQMDEDLKEKSQNLLQMLKPKTDLNEQSQTLKKMLGI